MFVLIVLVGPWPQMKATSSPSGKQLVDDEWISTALSPPGRTGAPHRAVEQHVAHKGERLFRDDDAANDRARTSTVRSPTVTRSPSLSHRSGVTARASIPIAAARFGEMVQKKSSCLVRPLDRHAEFLPERRRARRVIDMAMREEYLFDRHAILRDGLANAIEIAAGIDHRPHLGSVLTTAGEPLERRDGNDARRSDTLLVPQISNHIEQDRRAQHPRRAARLDLPGRWFA